MSFFGRLGGSMPYTKWNELNEDWILNTVKKLSEDWARYHADWEAWKDNTDQAFQDLHDYVMDYFANLDVSEEISEKLNQMAADGSLSELIAPIIPGVVTAWMDEHITPTTPPVDDTLTVTGAAADSKTVGQYMNADSQTTLLGLNTDLVVIDDPENQIVYFYLGLSWYLRGRYSRNKTYASIVEDGTVITGTAPNGQTNCVGLAYGRTLYYDLETNKLGHSGNDYPGAKRIALFYVTTSGTIKGGIGYRNYIETKVDKLTPIIEVLDLDSNYNAERLDRNFTRNRRSTQGIVYSWNDDGSCTIEGLTTGNTICNMYSNPAALPAGIIPGNTYYVNYSGVNVRFAIYDYSGGNIGTALFDSYNSGSFTVPVECTSLLIRLRTAGTGLDINETVNPIILTGKSNKELSEEIDKAEDYLNYINADSQTTLLGLNTDLVVIDDPENQIVYFYLGLSWYLRGRYSRNKTYASIVEDGTVITGTAPNGQTNCVGLAYGRTLYYDLETNKLGHSGNNYPGAKRIALFYVTTSGTIKGGIGYRNYIEELAKSNPVQSIPEYFQTQVDQKIEELTNNMGAGRSAFSMIHITDTHTGRNTGNSQKLIEYILKNTRLKYVLHNGDIITSNTTSKASAMDELRNHISSFNVLNKYLFVNMGNHDYNFVNNQSYPERMLTQSEIYACIMADMKDIQYYQNGAYHWVHIDQASSTALIGFQTGYNYTSAHGVLAEDMPYLTTLLDNLDVDNIIISAHMIFSQDATTELYTSLDNLNYQRIRGAINNSTNASKVKAIVTGHNHLDYATVDDGLLIVSTCNDRYNSTEDIGTINELAFDIMTFDYATNTLKTERIGRGSDRAIAF